MVEAAGRPPLVRRTSNPEQPVADAWKGAGPAGPRKLSRSERLAVNARLLAAAKREALERGTCCPECGERGAWDVGLSAVVCRTCGDYDPRTGEARGGPLVISRRWIPRAAVCGQKGIAAAGAVKLREVAKRKDGTSRAVVSGVYHCNKPWQCPKCAARVAAGDAQTLHACNLGWRGYVPDPDGSGRWVKMRTGRRASIRAERDRRAKRCAYLLTLTIPHHLGQALEPMRRAVTLAYSRMEETPDYRRKDPKRPGLRRRYGIAATVRRLEVTHGPSGWHPHIHAILFVERKLTAAEIESVREWYFVHWRAAVARLGYEPPTKAAGVDLCEADRGGRYLAKMGLAEIAGDATKVGRCARCGDYRGARWEAMRRRCEQCGHELNRTPWQILWDLADHKARRDQQLWRTYVAQIRGARRLTWSRDRVAGGLTIREAYAEFVRVPEQARCRCAGLDPDCKTCRGRGRYTRHRLRRVPFQRDLSLKGDARELVIATELWDLRFGRDPTGLAELIDAFERGDKATIEVLLGKYMPPAALPPDPEAEEPAPGATDDAAPTALAEALRRASRPEAPRAEFVLDGEEWEQLREARGRRPSAALA